MSAPAEKKEWVTALELEDLLEKFCEETVWARGEINQPELLKAIDSILASRIEAHIAAALGNSTCHQAMCRDELLWRASIELAEVRAALKEAEWWCRKIHHEWDEWYPGHRNLDNSECLWCKRFDELKAREAELLARGGAKP